MDKQQADKIKRFKSPQAQLIVFRSILRASLSTQQTGKNAETDTSKKRPVKA